jgi:uncharacterized membrane protein
MSTVWIVVVATAVGTVALKGAGPVLLGGRPLPARLDGVVRLAGPALLAALVAISTFGEGQSLVIDARVVGVAAAAVAIRLRAPALVVVVVAAIVTGVCRALVGG